MRSFSRILLAVALLALVAVIGYFGRQMLQVRQQRIESADVILGQMQAVTKLVTAEGVFSEIYDYKDYYRWDVSPLRKTALIRVKARVVLGYDLEKMELSIDSKTQTVRIGDPDRPEIIALDHTLDYYDLTSGTFNHFSEADLNMLNARARNFIEEVALQSDLPEVAAKRKAEIFETLRTIAESAGYQFEIVIAQPSGLRQ